MSAQYVQLKTYVDDISTQYVESNKDFDDNFAQYIQLNKYLGNNSTRIQIESGYKYFDAQNLLDL